MRGELPGAEGRGVNEGRDGAERPRGWEGFGGGEKGVGGVLPQ